MRQRGRITSWNDDRGFGFITPRDGGQQAFVHISALSRRQRRPRGNELVTYKLTVDDQGRSRAKAVTFVGERARLRPSRSLRFFAPTFAVCFLLFVVAMVIRGRLPLEVLGLYLAASVVAYLAYAIDKSAARRQRWRMQESTLHLFALLGGWPGALAAQRVLRHKTAKTSFQATFWVSVVLNCGALGWLLSPHGAQVLHSVLGTA